MLAKHRFLFSAALAAAGALLPAAAQAQTNLVSVCSGVSLPRSAVTDIMRPVITGVVTPVQNTVNPILGVVGYALPLVPTLSIDADGLLSSAAAGDPIRLQVLNTNNQVLAAGAACNAQADSYTLTTPGGVAIGGNGITGLGTSGQAATAGTADAIAIGNLAGTDGTAGAALALGAGAKVNRDATASLALGAGASASGANSVALGANSVADRGVPEVSIGAPGAERLLTNVAAGVLPTDAANMGQVNAVAANLATLAGRAVVYDGAGLTRVTLAGQTGTLLTNLAPGAVTAASTDAVNGSQLAALTGRVDALATTGPGPVRYADPGAPTVPNAGAVTNDAVLAGAAIGPVALHNLAAGLVAAGSTDAVNGDQLAAVSAAGANAVNYDLDGTGTRINAVTLTGGLAGTVTLRNVADGLVAAGSTDAVNGGQLAAVSAAGANAVNYDLDGAGTRTNIVTLTGGGGGTVALRNVADGLVAAGSTDAVNGDQLAATNQAVAALAAAGPSPIRYADPATPTVPNAGTTTNDAVLVGAAAGPVALHGIANGAVAAGSTDAVNGGQLAALTGRVDANTLAITNLGATISTLSTQVTSGAAGPVRYSSAAAPTTPSGAVSNDVTLVGATAAPVGLHNIAAGVVAAGSTDAVNGDQLAAVQAAGANAVNYDTDTGGARLNSVTLAGGAAGPVGLHNVAAGLVATGSTDAVNGGQLAATDATATAALALGQNAVQYDPGRATVTFAGNGGAVGLRNVAAGTVAAGSTDAVNGGQLFATNSTATAALALGQNAVQYDSGHNAVTLAGTGTGAVALHNVAAGTVAPGSTDAVNGDQLAATNAAVAQTQTTAASALALGQNAVQYDSGHNAVTLAGTGTGAVALHNVAAGTVAPGSTDAVNGGQLAAMGTAMATMGETAATALAASRNAVQYDAGDGGVTLNPSGTAMAVHNVAPGTSATDAATVGQVNSAFSGVLSAAEGYADAKLAAVSFDLATARRDAAAGSAAALAAAGLPQAFTPGANMIAIGGGTYGGESAVAIGISRVFGRHMIVRLSGSHDTRGRTSANGGVGFQF